MVACLGIHERDTFRKELSNEQVVEEFCRKAASQWEDFSRRKNLMRHRPSGSLLLLVRRIELSLLQQRPQPRLPMFLNWPDNPKKLSLPLGDRHPSNKWFLGCTLFSLPNGISIGSAVFARLTNVTNTDAHIQTDHATPSVAIGRSLAIAVMRPNNDKSPLPLTDPRDAVLRPTVLYTLCTVSVINW